MENSLKMVCRGGIGLYQYIEMIQLSNVEAF